MRPLYACLDGNKEKDKTVTSAGEDMEKLKLSYVADRNVNGAAPLENFISSSEVRHRITV